MKAEVEDVRKPVKLICIFLGSGVYMHSNEDTDGL